MISFFFNKQILQSTWYNDTRKSEWYNNKRKYYKISSNSDTRKAHVIFLASVITGIYVTKVSLQ